ncbi:MAG TPA: FtsX-like permease family protein, partial [Blastocatellia bacterium]|nr:FtsX-like permease family protein [Blastocatellia bacterium]
EPASLGDAVRAQVLAVDQNQPLSAVRPLESMIASSVDQQRFLMLLTNIFAAIGLVLAAVGIYGAISFTVAQRTREIGIRMALGADRRRIMAMVLGHGLRLGLTGIGVGIVVTLALSRLVSNALFQVSPNNPEAIGAASVLLLLVSLLACCLPAAAATRVDPMTALRQE